MSVIMLGTLASQEEVISKFDKSKYNVYKSYNGKSCVIKCISKQPEMWDSNSLYACNVNFLDDELEKKGIEEIERVLAGKYITFKPDKKLDGRLVAYDPRYASVSSFDKVKDSTFIAIPCFDLKKLGLSIEEFEAALLNGNRLEYVPFISKDEIDCPSLLMVIYEDKHDYHVYLYGGYCFEEFESTYVTIKCDKISKVEFDLDNDYNYLIECSTEYNIVFLTNDIEIKYSDLLCSMMAKPDEEIVTVEPTVNFIDKLRDFMYGNGFIYDLKDLLEFDLASRSSQFIILSGMSGTGKSKLIWTYCDALGISDYDGVKFISVASNWNSDIDILGYVDCQCNLYREADCGLVSFLIEAAKHPDRRYFVCLDEMNLSKVENYFSQFISVLENVLSRRFLNLYNKNSVLVNSMIYPSSVPIYDNVVFVGTINVDESTIMLSDKVLDRARVINLKMLPYSELKAVYKDFVLTDREIEFFTVLNELLTKENPRFCISYRVISQFNRSLCSLGQDQSFVRAEVFDRLFCECIVPKLRGSSIQLGSLVGNININGNYEAGLICKLFENFKDVSDFVETVQVLESKARVLKYYGYTI